MNGAPWWLPEDIDSTAILEAWDTKWKFTGGELPHAFSPVDVPWPIVIFDRILTNEETATVAHALARNDMEAVCAAKPLHVRYGGDVDAVGTCRCRMCNLTNSNDCYQEAQE